MNRLPGLKGGQICFTSPRLIELFQEGKVTISDLKSNRSLLHVRPPSCWNRYENERTAQCVERESSQAVKLPLSPRLLETGQGRAKCLAGLLPKAHCYPSHGGSHCCASSLCLTTSVNKDLNNKQRNASQCVTVSFTGLRFSSAPATLMTPSKAACNGRLISFLWRH